MNTRLILGIILFCIAMSGVLLGNISLIRMIGEINRRKEEGDLISYVGFTLPKYLRIFREYRNLYPNGKLLTHVWLSTALAMAGMIGVAICLRIIPFP